MVLVRFQPSPPNLIRCGVIGNTTDFDSVVLGSIPSTGANALVVKWHNTFLVRMNRWFNSILEHQLTGFGEMDIITVFETAGRGSIPLSPAIRRKL